MKRTIVILLAMLITVSFLQGLGISAGAADSDIAQSGEKTLVSEVEIAGGAAPVAGGQPDYSWSIHTFDSKYYSIEGNAWHNLTDKTQMAKSSTFSNNKTYALELILKAGSEYKFVSADNITVRFLSQITATSYVVYNEDADGKRIHVFFNFRMSGDTDSCIVSLLPNGGTGVKTPVIVRKGYAYDLPGNPFTPPYGNIFRTWDAGSTGDTITVNKDMSIKAEWRSLLINTIGVTGIHSPSWTTSPDYSPSSLVGSGYKLNTEYDDGEYIINGIEWRDQQGNRVPHNLGFSNSDTRYNVTIYLKSNDLRWFNEKNMVTATVNGNRAVVQKDTLAADPDSGKYIKMTYGFMSQVSIMWVKVPEPVAFKKPSYSPNVDNNYSAKLNTSINTGDFTRGVYWYDLNTGSVMSPDDVFLPGHAYRVTIAIAPANNYEFPVDNDLHTIIPSLEVNNTPVTRGANGYGDFTDVGLRGETNAWVTYEFPEVEYTAETISSVAVTVHEPVAGEKLSYEASVPSGAVYAKEAYTSDYWIDGVGWEDAKGAQIRTDSDTVFEPGAKYTVTVSLEPADKLRYEFAESGLSATVNGKEAKIIVFEPKKIIFVMYSFTIPEEQSVAYVLGDADGDGEVTILDATAIQRVLASLPVDLFDEAAADADEDGEVTILDATAIQRYLAGLPTSENIGKQF